MQREIDPNCLLAPERSTEHQPKHDRQVCTRVKALAIRLQADAHQLPRDSVLKSRRRYQSAKLEGMYQSGEICEETICDDAQSCNVIPGFPSLSFYRYKQLIRIFDLIFLSSLIGLPNFVCTLSIFFPGSYHSLLTLHSRDPRNTNRSGAL